MQQIPALPINASAVRRRLGNFFSGSVSEILGELFQNSQRAGARNVTIEADSDAFSYCDDGQGLTGNDPFYALVTVGDSNWEAGVTENQSPLGLGLNALIYAENVSRVTVSSNGRKIIIDTKRWINDDEYATRWRDLIEEDAPQIGIEISAVCGNAFLQKLEEALFPQSHSRGGHPAEGYGDLLAITYNGREVETKISPVTRPTLPLFTGTYMNCRWEAESQPTETDWFSGGSSRLAVNHYGQIVIQKFPTQCYLHVREGRPLNFLSPSRKGVIEDAKLDAFRRHITDEIFRFVSDPANEASVTPKMVETCFALDEKRAKTLPYLLATPFPVFTPGIDADELNKHGKVAVLRYDDEPLLLNDSIELSGDSRPDHPFTTYDYGLPTFIPEIGRQPYRPVKWDDSRLPAQTLLWKPGPRLDGPLPCFHEAGEWALEGPNDEPVWQPVKGEVFAFMNASTSPDSAEAVIGGYEPLAFIEGDDSAALFGDWESNDYYSDYQTAYDDFERGLREWALLYRPDSIPGDFQLHHVREYMADKSSPIVSIEAHYHNDELRPHAITATNRAGETKTLSILKKW